MYNTILVPLDGSRRAEAILPHVEYLAQLQQKTRVILLQVVEPAPLIVGPDVVYPMFDQEDQERRVKEAKSYLAARQGQLREKGIETLTLVGHGPIVQEIINAADREQADLVAMASHGRTGLARVFYGSVAAGLLHRIDRPLLLIRAEGDE